MEEIIKQMSVEQLVNLINECSDDFGTHFPKIMENDDLEIWEEINRVMTAQQVANGVSNGRYYKNDSYLIVVDDGPVIYSFTDKYTLFQYLSPKDIASLCKDNDIELTIEFKRK